MQRLPEAELEVMLAVWQAEGEVNRAALEERLVHRGWNANTVNTLLGRLQDKGFLHCRREGRTKWYTPAVARESYQGFEGAHLLQRLYGSSLKNFVAALADTQAVDAGQMQELQSYLLELGREHVDE